MIEKYIRLATLADIPVLIDFAKAFHKASPYRGMRFDTKKGHEFFERVITGALEDHVTLIALKDGKPIGFLVGAASQPHFSSTKVAMELGWWIDEKHRRTRASVLIYQAYEDWAIRIGCSHVQGAYLPGVSPPLDAFYKSRGYTQVESSFLKTLRIL